MFAAVTKHYYMLCYHACGYIFCLVTDLFLDRAISIQCDSKQHVMYYTLHNCEFEMAVRL